MPSAILLLMLVVNGSRAWPMDADSTMVLAWELLEDARYGQDPQEHAAFIVIGKSGQLELSRWRWGAESMRATYRGAIPRRAVAIIHTHPRDLPGPSRADMAVAQKLGMPVYVITRTAVTVTDGSRTTQVAFGDWNPRR
jgi:hypothetical protein